MDREFLERKVRELTDSELLDLLKIRHDANQEIIFRRRLCSDKDYTDPALAKSASSEVFKRNTNKGEKR